MENMLSLNDLGHGIEQWVCQLAHRSPLPENKHNQLLELLLSQSDLGGLLTTFADHAARVVQIHSLYLKSNQPHVLIQRPPLATLNLHNYLFELRGQHGQLLGQLHYQLKHPLGAGQQRVLMQYHQLLCLLLPLYLRLEKLDQLVRLDHLTGLGNRSYFDEAIGRAIEQHSREPHGLVLVLLDLDRFKQINDTWGHPVGDLVLSCFAQLLREGIRSTDQAFRLGGDEFALLLQPAEPEAWRPVWLRLQHMLMAHQDLNTFSVGFSLGAASWQAGIDVQSLYQAADSHLYARKKAGKASPNE